MQGLMNCVGSRKLHFLRSIMSEHVFQLTDQVFNYMEQIFKCRMGIADMDAVVRPIHFPVDLVWDCELMAGQVAQAYHTRGGSLCPFWSSNFLSPGSENILGC